MSRLFGSKGLGPIVATVLLVSIVVSVSALVYYWTNDLSVRMSTDFGNITKSKINCQRNNFYIENASLNCTNTLIECDHGEDKTFSFYMRNSGEGDITLENLYLRNLTSGLMEFNLNTVLRMGDDKIIMITTKEGCSEIIGNIPQIIVTTDCPELYDVYTGDIINIDC
ncbi:MAG: archaellin/type IV pilin N-terminal domain-containing protein [Candidatus Aenigmatarchaeota archaeon]